MKMTKILTSALAVAMISGVAIAQDSTGAVATSTTSSESLLSKLEKSPLDFNFYTEHGFDANTLPENVASETSKGNTLTKYSAVYTGKLAYKISSKTTASIYGRFDTVKNLATTDTEKAATTTAWNRVILAVSQKILNEAKHGVNLGTTLEKRSIPDTGLRGNNNVNGHTRLVSNVNKSFGNFSMGATYFLAVLDRKDTTRATTRYYHDIALDQSYSFTDKFSISASQDYFMPKDKVDGIRELNGKEIEKVNNDYIELALGVNYAVTSKVTVGAGVSSIAFAAHDERHGSNVENWTRTPSYNLNLAITAF